MAARVPVPEVIGMIAREKLTDFEVVQVDDQNVVHMTPGIERVLKLVKPPTPGP